MAMRIETSTDSVEEVKEALKDQVEIEEPEAEEAEKPPVEEEKPEADETETETEEGEEEGEEEAEAEAKPKETTVAKKTASRMVPAARLNKEIERRKRAEQRLADQAEEPDDEPEDEPEEKAPTTEKRPVVFSGKAEPQLETFMKDVDELDGKAVAKATAAFSKAYSDWSREEGRAEAAYNLRQEQIQAAFEELTEPFIERRDAFQAAYPEYNEIVGKSQVQLTSEQQEFVYESEAGPQMLWYFTEHPREARRMSTLGKRQWSAAMLDVEAKAIKKYGSIEAEPEDEDEEPVTPVKRTLPPNKKPITSKAPEPPSRIKSQGPGPKSAEDLAGPRDRTGIDIKFNPELERMEKAKRAAR